VEEHHGSPIGVAILRVRQLSAIAKAEGLAFLSLLEHVAGLQLIHAAAELEDELAAIQ
jgi:hypothetical protein